MKWIASVIVLTALTAGCQKGADLPESLAQEVAACDTGDMTSCENAAGAFENGTGVPPDPTRAAELRERLVRLANDYCNQGQAHGCSYLGRAHVEGIGVESDRDMGISLLRRGCTGGDPLACIYLENLGVSKSAGMGTEPPAPTPDLFDEIEKRASAAEHRLAEDLRNRPK
ncbi:MAG: tetratricopeptide repeat protein [Gammaproteobacteria bacterium]